MTSSPRRTPSPPQAQNATGTERLSRERAFPPDTSKARGSGRKTQPPSLTERTVLRGLDLIRERGLRQGDALPAGDELVRLFGVSRVALREAMSYLKGLGVIQGGRGNTFRVARVDPVAILETLVPLAFATSSATGELLELRRALELGCIEDAVRHATPEQVVGLRDIAAEMRKLVESAAFGPQSYDALEVEFHRRIAVASGCRLLGVLTRVLGEYFARRPWSGPPEQHRDVARVSTTEHEVLAAAFALRDTVLAYIALRRHLRSVVAADLSGQSMPKKRRGV